MDGEMNSRPEIAEKEREKTILLQQAINLLQQSLLVQQPLKNKLQIITDNIIGAARRGKITTAGKKVMLVPDKRTGTANSCGYRHFKSVKKNECLKLKNLTLK